MVISSTPTRDKLRAVVRIVNQTINVLKAAQHPEKTFIGRASTCIDWFHLTPTGVAKTTIHQ
ncbi:MAG: hypothetical protein DRR19_25045 [Candidatus Parabeggiatoa sp. nov. 1]|nr:MAG: hypothetical protein DRR19_25045 [Gammaproteobacteria bacterium]